MEAAASSLSLLSLASAKTRSRVAQNCHVTRRQGCHLWVKNERRRTSVGAVNVDDVAPVEITWQIVVGAIENGVLCRKLGFDILCLNFAAGVTPFVVAGIEFSKRIIAQRRCEVCGGSGLVLREKDYLRCPGRVSSLAVVEKILLRLISTALYKKPYFNNDNFIDFIISTLKSARPSFCVDLAAV
ncbi:hypothetical protein CR513_40177, partial [Mucuna pruriens]